MYFEPAPDGSEDDFRRFTSRGAGYGISLRANDSYISVFRQPSERSTATDPISIKQVFVGSDPNASAEGREKLSSRSNYFNGSDQTKWRTNVPNFQRVHFENVYQGIDLVYYGSQQQLEYDLVVRPFADPGVIKLGYEGVLNVVLTERGELELEIAHGKIVQKEPFIYQLNQNGERVKIEGKYKIENELISFELGEYDHSRPLTIDPIVLVFSTFNGGSDFDFSGSIALDSSDNAYIAGYTFSQNFPLQNPKQSLSGGSADVFVTKLAANGSSRIYSTYIGGSGSDVGGGIAVNSAGEAYVTGQTSSTNFPTFNAYQGPPSGSATAAFVTKLSAAGNSLVYSTYLHGSVGDSFGNKIALDSSGRAVITGSTNSSDYPTLTPFQLFKSGGFDAFVTKMNSTGNGLVFSSFLGGLSDDSGRAVALGLDDQVYVAGQTSSSNFPRQFAAQSVYGGNTDAFLTSIFPNGGSIYFSTFLGGTGLDQGIALTVNESSYVFLAGQTESSDLPLYFQSQTSLRGSRDSFVACYDIGGSLVYSTYLGGTGVDNANGVAADSTGRAFITGSTNSSDHPLKNALKTILSGTNDAFVTTLAPLSSAIVYSSYLGGNDFDIGYGIAVSKIDGSVYVTGRTGGSTFPVSNAVQPIYGGGLDAFVTKFSRLTSSVSGRFRDKSGRGIVLDTDHSRYIYISITGHEDFAELITDRYNFDLIPFENYSVTPDMSGQHVNSTITPLKYDFTPVTSDRIADFTLKVANDDLATAFSLTTTANGTIAGATKEAGEPDHFGSQGGRSVWYKWTAPVTGRYGIKSTIFFGGDSRILLDLYNGSSVAGLTRVETVSGRTNNELFFDAIAGTHYFIAVDDYAGNVPDTFAGFEFDLIIAPQVTVSGTITNVNGRSLDATITASCNTGTVSGSFHGDYILNLPLGTSLSNCTVTASGSGVFDWTRIPTPSGFNFVGTSPSYNVSGTLVGLTSISPGTAVTLSGNNIVSRTCNVGLNNTTSPPTVTYACIGLSHRGDYFITPSSNTHVFTPSMPNTGEFFNITSTYQNQNFASAQAPAAPVILGISPTSATAGSGSIVLSVTGTNFTNQSYVLWNGSGRPTSFVSPTQLQVDIFASDLAAAGQYNVQVFTPAPGGGTSNTVVFSVMPPSMKAKPFDFDGDSRADVTVYRPSDNTWYLSLSQDGYKI
ncbi:MAG: SBBP repeat-containing protein, partial [Acidobacteriota bacterium]